MCCACSCPSMFTGLGHVNCYALEDERGFAARRSRSARAGRVGRAARPPRSGVESRCRGCTRSSSPTRHPGPLRRRRPAARGDRGGHPHPLLVQAVVGARRRARRHAVRRAGRPVGLVAADAVGHPVPAADRRWDEQDARRDAVQRAHARGPRGASRTPRWSCSPAASGCRCTRPGHTPDHLCLYDPTYGVVLAGDHVLPTITPHIGAMDGFDEDPLAEFFHSLDRMAALPDVSVALPAHGHPFHDLAKRVHGDRGAPRRPPRPAARGVHRARPAGAGARADAAPVLRAGVGLDGRVGDLRPPRAPPPQRRGHSSWVDGLLCYEVVES